MYFSQILVNKSEKLKTIKTLNLQTVTVIMVLLLLCLLVLSNAIQINHYVKYLQKDTLMEKYVILDDCVFYDDESFARMKYFNNQFIRYKYDKNDTTCVNGYVQEEYEPDDMITGTLENKYETLETDALTGRNTYSYGCYKIMLSAFYFNVQTTCFNHDEYFYGHEQRENTWKLIKYSSKADCESNTNEIEEKEVAQCSCSHDDHVGYEFGCSTHYVTYQYTDTYERVHLILDECVFMEGGTMSIITMDTKNHNEFHAKVFNTSGCTGDYEDNVYDISDEMIQETFEEHNEMFRISTVSSMRIPSNADTSIKPGKLYKYFVGTCFQCGEYSCTHSLQTIDGKSAYCLQKYISDDCSGSPIIAEWTLSCGYTNSYYGDYGYDSYCKYTNYITYTKRKHYSEVTIILEECVYYNPFHSHVRLHLKNEQLYADLYNDYKCSENSTSIPISLNGEVYITTAQLHQSVFEPSKQRTKSLEQRN